MTYTQDRPRHARQDILATPVKDRGHARGALRSQVLRRGSPLERPPIILEVSRSEGFRAEMGT